LINPNDNLTIDVVSSHAKIVGVESFLESEPYMSKNNNETIRVDYYLSDKTTISDYFTPKSEHHYPKQKWREYQRTKKYIKAVKLIQEGGTWKIKQTLTESHL
jgi:hypothetical protein